MKTLKVIFLFIITFFAIVLNAQITIDGTITDSDLNPINNALIEIIDQNDTSNYYSSTTNESGYFLFSNITGIDADRTNLPSDFIVIRNYPNPFNPSTIIYYELPKSENAEIKIYDILGREVRTLFNGFHKTGNYTISWDGRNNWNSPVAAGVYFCMLKTKDKFKVHKMVLLDGGSAFELARFAKLKKPTQKNISKVNNNFNFTIKVSGDNILNSEFQYLSCSRDTTLNLLVPKILAKTAIGIEGGKFGNDDFVLDIPPGAFTETTDIVLSLETDSIDFGDKTYSKLFRVDGLPEFFNSDLNLKIKVNETPVDSISIAITKLDTNIFFSNGYYNYDYYSAEYADGYANLVIPSTLSSQRTNLFEKRNELGIDNYAKKLFIVLASPGVVRSSNDNFIIRYPKSHAYFIPYIDEYLESAVDTIVKLGFHKLPLETNFIESNWPVIVSLVYETPYDEYLLKINISRVERVFSSSIKHSYDQIYINKSLKDIFCDDTILERSLGANVFQIFLNQDYIHSSTPDDYYLLYSVARWTEKLFPFNEHYINSMYEFENNNLLAFFKLENINYVKAILEIAEHDNDDTPYPYIPIIEYLSQYSGKKRKIIYDLYNEIRNSIESKNSSIEGLMKLMDREEIVSLPDFYKKYLQGSIYNIPIKDILNNVSETIDFEEGDTLKFIDDQNWEFKDLSAKLFKIMINSDEIRNNGMLNFKLGPENLDLKYAKAFVFGLKGNSILFIGEGSDFLVGNLNQYDGLLACIVNNKWSPSFDGKTIIDMAIKTKITQLPFEGYVGVNAHFLQDLHVKTQSDEWDETGVDRVTNDWFGKVKLVDDSTYIGNWDEEDQVGYNHKGNMKLIIDPDTKNLKYFEAEETQDGDQFTLITESITSKLLNLQIYSEEYKGWNYLVRGIEACDITNTFYYSSENKYDEGEEIMIKYYCDESSGILINLNYDL